MFLADSFGGFVVMAIVGGVIALVIWSVNHQKKVRENWRQFGLTHGLNIQGSPNRPFIQGWMGSVYVTLNTEVRGSGKNRTTYTQFHATINAPMPSGMQLYKEGFFSKVGKVLGGQDVQLGDSAMDTAFIIKGNDLLGIHNLLRNPHLKKALLYCVSRQPALRVNERALLVEHTGMTGDRAKIEAVFADLTYLVQTFDAAYQELAGAAPAKPTRKSQPRVAPISSKAAAAEILGTEFFKQPQVRQAASDEDPATRKAAMSEMANALHQYEGKLERGEAQPDVLTSFARADAMDAMPNDTFKATDPSNVFAVSDSSGRSALDSYNPANAWHSKTDEGDTGQSGFAAFDAPLDSHAFDDPKPFEAPEPEHKGDVAENFDALVAMLSDSSLMSSDREKIIKTHERAVWPVEMTVDRVESTWGFDLPSEMKDGKTIEGHAGERKLTLRFPKARTSEVANLRGGETLKARGKLAAWDDLFKKATLDVM